MKNLLIMGAIGIGLYYAFGKKKDDAAGQELSELDAFLDEYNNRIVYDSDGIWFLVKDGKIASPLGQASLDAYYKQYPEYSEVLHINEPIWFKYAESNPEIYNQAGF